MLSDEQIKRFQSIYKGYYGKEINRDEACRQGTNLIQLLEIIYKPMTEGEYQRVEQLILELNDE
jgi:hypothetical protein